MSKGESIAYIGLILKGSAFLQVDQKTYGQIDVGDLFGFLGLFELSGYSFKAFKF